jgi:hypothetical protein
MVVSVEVISGLMKTFEAPSIQLARERFKFALSKEFRCDLSNKELLIMDLPCPPVRLSLQMWSREYCRSDDVRGQCSCDDIDRLYISTNLILPSMK